MIKIKVKKSRMWIPALGVVIAYGFFHNCAIAPYFNYHEDRSKNTFGMNAKRVFLMLLSHLCSILFL